MAPSSLDLATATVGEPLLEVEDLHVHFDVKGRRRAKLRAVDGVTFAIRAGETFGLIGESGSGKSTISRAILQLVDVRSGSIRFRDRSILDMGRRERRLARRHVQTVFQDPHASLDPRMTVWQSVCEPMRVQRIGTAAERRQRALEMLERVGLSEDHARRFPHEISGGQKQRVSIARALVLEPELLLCDEAVSALDVALQAEILNLLAELQKDLGLAYLFITHDLSVVAHIADRIGVMYLGQLVEIGSVEDVVDRPAHPYSEALLDAQPLPLPSRLRTEERTPLSGDIPSPIHPPSGCRFRTRCPYVRPRCAEEIPQLRPIDHGHVAACHFSEELGLGGLAALTSAVEREMSDASVGLDSATDHPTPHITREET